MKIVHLKMYVVSYYFSSTIFSLVCRFVSLHVLILRGTDTLMLLDLEMLTVKR